jgi:hypothetical protein
MQSGGEKKEKSSPIEQPRKGLNFKNQMQNDALLKPFPTFFSQQPKRHAIINSLLERNSIHSGRSK